MPKEIYLVKVGMSMTEGMVSEWYIPDGGAVKKGELVYALETEKVNLDVDAEADGIVKHLAEPGVMLAPGDVVGLYSGVCMNFHLVNALPIAKSLLMSAISCAVNSFVLITTPLKKT